MCPDLKGIDRAVGLTKGFRRVVGEVLFVDAAEWFGKIERGQRLLGGNIVDRLGWRGRLEILTYCCYCRFFNQFKLDRNEINGALKFLSGGMKNTIAKAKTSTVIT